jgi:phage shock protein PspC (stress-responsive transcriptional regulator)
MEIVVFFGVIGAIAVYLIVSSIRERRSEEFHRYEMERK